MYNLVVAVAQLRPIHRGSLMRHDDDSACPNPDRRLHQFEIIIRPQTQIWIRVNVHVDNTLLKIHSHLLCSSLIIFYCCFLTGIILY